MDNIKSSSIVLLLIFCLSSMSACTTFSMYGVYIPPLEIRVENTSSQDFYILEGSETEVFNIALTIQDDTQHLTNWFLVPSHKNDTHTFPEQDFAMCIQQSFPSFSSSNKKLHERILFVHGASSRITYRIHLKGIKVKLYRVGTSHDGVDWEKAQDITVLESSRSDELDSISIRILD